jgi:hypothetical protein
MELLCIEKTENVNTLVIISSTIELVICVSMISRSCDLQLSCCDPHVVNFHKDLIFAKMKIVEHGSYRDEGAKRNSLSRSNIVVI